VGTSGHIDYYGRYGFPYILNSTTAFPYIVQYVKNNNLTDTFWKK
jgi:hypothetical protein